MKLSVKLPVLVITSVLISSVAVGVANFISARSSITSISQHQIEVIAEDKKEMLESYFNNVKKDAVLAADSLNASQGLLELMPAWDTLEGNKTKYLHFHYIKDNPNPTGQKHKLDYAKDGSVYSQVHKRIHPWFRKMVTEVGYYDIFLFDLKGNMIYSVFKEADFATNFVNGELKDTGLAKVYNQALNMEKGDVMFDDFRHYAPSNGPAAFAASPVFDENGQRIGVFALQMPIDKMNNVIESVNLGKTAHAYLVGSDKALRSNYKFQKDGILKDVVDNEAVALALAGKTGVTEVKEPTGNLAYSAYSPMSAVGLDWGLLLQVEEDEILAPVAAIKNKTIMIILASLAIIGLIGFAIIRSIIGKLVMLNDDIDRKSVV
jgi:methyl-accepting chemotaxis protein